jgi:hypothetical protein
MAGKRAAERIEKQEVPAQLAGRVRRPGDDGAVTLSGRCGRCGYLLGSPGHQVTCGT